MGKGIKEEARAPGREPVSLSELIHQHVRAAIETAVHEELRGTGVSCTVVCPGPVATPWAEIADAQAVMIPGTVMSSPMFVR